MKNRNLSIILTGLLIISILAVPVSAEVFEKVYEDKKGQTVQPDYTASNIYTSSWSSDNVYFYNKWEDYSGLYYFAISSTSPNIRLTSNQDVDNIPFTIKYGSKIYASGKFSYREKFNYLNQYSGFEIWFLFDEFKSEELINDNVPISSKLQIDSVYDFNGKHGSGLTLSDYKQSIRLVQSGTGTYQYPDIQGFIVTATSAKWKLKLHSDFQPDQVNYINAEKYGFVSNITLKNENGDILFNDKTSDDYNYHFVNIPLYLEIENPFGKKYNEILGSETSSPDEVNILTHVYSTADKSLIGGATVTYNATDGSDTQTKTFSSGEGIVKLKSNLEYSVTASADGYRMQEGSAPTVSFSQDTQFGLFLTPTGTNVSAGSGVINFYVKTYTPDGNLEPLEGALIQINGKSLISNSAGYAQYEINKTAPITYSVSKDGYISFSRTHSPEWPESNVLDEFAFLRKKGMILPGEPTPQPTLDTRTQNQKAESALNIILDNIEAIAALAVVVVILSFVDYMTPRRRR
ncbi:hypothetical protein F1737_04385 [Methanoplanus sp. FWC-SCC4]|uniref:Uncharacterized protein n=1 Tax=Methanochimaera problematica TaxID=2609417 RepID=A0AA97FD30_9EURY|nr:hypothetical protein [Methanoplanus sp. FWC-SCC4]WOF15993.1 hypothetical protein F1737_04385 [Methanoplanus sp. FWC-SCC4]